MRIPCIPCFRPLTGINFNKEYRIKLERIAFSSPLGDKFQHSCAPYCAKSFAPFPSPHGDKFQLRVVLKVTMMEQFPSPHGDKFQQGSDLEALTVKAFPSPHGDKFQQQIKCRWYVAFGFRPLSGINFNCHVCRNERNAGGFPSPHGDKFQPLNDLMERNSYVSVPSRG